MSHRLLPALLLYPAGGDSSSAAWAAKDDMTEERIGCFMDEAFSASVVTAQLMAKASELN